MRIRAAVILLLLVFSAVPLAIQGVVGHRLVSETLEDRAFAQLESVSDIQERRLELILDRDRDRYELIVDRNQLRESLAALDRDEGTGHAERLRRILVDINTTADDLVHLHLFTTSGMLAASTLTRDPAPRVLDWRDAAFAGLRLDLFAVGGNGAIVHGIAGPVFQGGERIGTILIETDARSYLELVGLYDGLGETGETTIVFRDEDGDARFLAPTRFDPDAAFRRVVPVEDRDSPSVMGLVARGDANREAVDYRGEVVLASIRYVEPLDWVLVTKMDRDEALAPADGLLAVLVAITAAAVLAAVLLGSAAGFRLLARPVQESATYADRVRRGEAADAPTVRRGGVRLDEVQALDDAVHAMAEGLQATARYRAGLLNATSHALRTPLTPIKMGLFQLERSLQGEPEQDLVQRLVKNFARLEHTVEAFVGASLLETQSGPLQPRETDVARLVRDFVAERVAEAQDRGVAIEAHAPEQLVVDVDPSYVRLALDHVVDVALRNTPTGGRVDVRAFTRTDELRVVVDDTGPPVAAGMEEEAFDAFPTLAQQDQLVGRPTEGLATARRVMDMHRGRAWLENRPKGIGTRVVLAIPAARVRRSTTPSS